MSRMLRLELLGLLLLACTQILTEHRDFYGSRNQYGHRSSAGRGGGGGYHGPRTRTVEVKYGRLRGTVVQPKADNLQHVDVFLGVPYAEPPVGRHRFEPPTTQTQWNGVRDFVSFAPVCPQKLPSTEEVVDATRHEYLKRLLPFLKNQSEDCLYLNIYAPHQNNSRNLEKYPVMVFIHGESYEWNSGNPYDGSVLAAYGNVVFVTVNFRLGILGFLRPGTKDDTASNFGLLDQIAALVWLRDNISAFGGDRDSITLLGHGSGAVFAHLLLLSPMNNLFKRAILMSGSALNPDAIGKAPLQITKQVAHYLNCPQVRDEELMACLKNRSVKDLLSARIEKPKYVPAFAPLVDSAVIPDKPANLMKNAERLARFDLMYGVTELEKFHVLPGVALLEGLSASARDEFIRDSVKASHELEPDLILRKVLAHYEAEARRRAGEYEGNKYEGNRELALEVVSDDWVVAPLVATANQHSKANPKSYMYVFSHLKSIRDKPMEDMDQQIRRTVHGEELPYVLGVPLGGEGYHLSAPYDRGEALLSKAMMDWWCNFAYSGNPNNVRPPPRRLAYLRNDYGKASSPYDIDWPEYDPENQTYFNLTTPPQIGARYRAAEMEFWNEAIPHLLRRPKAERTATQQQRPQRPGFFDVVDHDYGGRANGSAPDSPANSVLSARGNSTTGDKLEPPSNYGDGKTDKPPDKSNGDGETGGGGAGSALRNSSAVSLVIGFGIVFLLINATALVYLYHKRQRMRKKAANAGNLLGPRAGNISGGGASGATPDAAATVHKRPKTAKAEQHRELGYCNSASKPDIRDLIKNDKAYDNNSNFGRRSRENSSSTIDTRIKVREWIQQEIVHRCSPRFLRKTRETLQREHREKLMKQQQQHQHSLQQTDDADEEEEEEEEELEEELRRRRLYEERLQIRVRPGVSNRREQQQQQQPKPAKVSVAVDATPGARTESVLNQIPIELARATGSSEYLNCLEDAATTILGTSEYCEPAELGPATDDEVMLPMPAVEARGAANIVIIEHHHSRSDPLPMDKLPSYSACKAISSAARINESDSGSASSLYAKINPRTKSRLPRQQRIQAEHFQHQPPADLEVRSQQQSAMAAGCSTTLPRLLTFGSPASPPAAIDVNVTSRETAAVTSEASHEEALRTIRRRNYPKVLPDIEKRRSLPPNASFVIGAHQPALKQQPPSGHFAAHRQAPAATPVCPPSPPPRVYGTSRSLDCVEDQDEEEDEEMPKSSLLPVTTNLHVGPLRKKTDSPKNQSVPSLTDAADNNNPKMSSATSMPMCPIHGASREAIVPPARSEPRIVITPRAENIQEATSFQQAIKEEDELRRPDCPSRRPMPERATKLPRIIIKPTGTIPRSGSKPAAATVVAPSSSQLQDNETYQRLLLARREKMPLPGEMQSSSSRIPSFRRLERVEVVQRVNAHDEAAVTKL